MTVEITVKYIPKYSSYDTWPLNVWTLVLHGVVLVNTLLVIPDSTFSATLKLNSLAPKPKAAKTKQDFRIFEITIPITMEL